MTPACHLVLKENFTEFTAGHTYRMLIDEIHPTFLDAEYIINFPEFDDEFLAYIEPVRGLRVHYSVPKTLATEGDYTRMRFMKTTALKTFQKEKYAYLLKLAKHDMISKNDIPKLTGSEDSVSLKSGEMSPLIFKSTIESLKNYIDATKKLDSDFIRENATVTVRATYLINCKHHLDVWKRPSGDKIRSLKKNQYSHILTIENKMNMGGDSPDFGQWRISDFDLMVKTEAYAFKNYLKTPSKYLDGPPPKDINVLLQL